MRKIVGAAALLATIAIMVGVATPAQAGDRKPPRARYTAATVVEDPGVVGYSAIGDGTTIWIDVVVRSSKPTAVTVYLSVDGNEYVVGKVKVGVGDTAIRDLTVNADGETLNVYVR